MVEGHGGGGNVLLPGFLSFAGDRDCEEREREGSNTYSSPLQRTLPFSIYNSALCGNAVDKS